MSTEAAQRHLVANEIQTSVEKFENISADTDQKVQLCFA
ncbi:hypothetical protein Mal48_15190 [Thalassoglobus polymorphus]|uniref:Uncharacterized protein n=1 Tax=Thalassoglobus polymorphus TaxID=2527994 RepID=A0A517QKW7_9PLAN|nr:hypothetical protein Mal48_15190 [Thalassoglobus polymorphus]